MPKYSKRFYSKRKKQIVRYKATARAVLDTLDEFTYPGYPVKCVADIGCATGLLLSAITDLRPMTTLYGLDLLPVSEQNFRGFYTQADLNEPVIELPDLVADVIICEEVLEHIEPENTDIAMGHISGLADKPGFMVFGAAAPGQPGKHHVNCRSKEEWAALWGKLGWHCDQHLTSVFKGILAEQGLDKGCYYDNPQVFTK